jgi:histidyl-tRNA synthetase
VLRTLDKFVKVGLKGVTALLKEGLKDDSGAFIDGLNLSDNQIVTITSALRSQRSWIGIANELDTKLAEEWRAYIALLDSFDVNYKLDITIARGLSYYTGPVFEIVLENPDETQKAGGAIGAGGAYDLNKKNGGQPLPAFGVSVGVDRLSKVLPKPEAAKPLIVVMSMNDDILWEQTTAAQLRAAGLRTLAYPGRVRNFTKRLKWADKTGAAFVVFRGEDEKSQGLVQIKDLDLGKQLSQTLSNEDWKAQPQQQSIPEGQLLNFLKKKV